jgi:Ras-related protein Rab-39B
VGKTSLVKHFTDGHSWSNAGSTIGVEYCNAKIVQVDGHNLKLDLWDTAGEERFSSIIRPYYRNVVGVLLVFDVTKRESFANIPEWIDDVEQSARPHKPVFILVGNKCDQETDREVSKNEAQSFATQHGMDYIETSAETGDNVEEAYVLVARRIYEAIQDGTIELGNNWDGIKKGDEFPKELNKVNLNQRRTMSDVNVEKRGCCN